MTVIKLSEADMSILGDLGDVEVPVPDGGAEVVSGAELGRLALEDLLDGETIPYGDLLLTYPVQA